MLVFVGKTVAPHGKHLAASRSSWNLVLKGTSAFPNWEQL